MPVMLHVVILVFDKKSNKAVKATFPLYSISYTWHVEDTLRTVKWSPEKGEQIESKENPHQKKADYNMRPVEDLIPDPTVNPGGLKDFIDEQYRQRGMTPPADIPGMKTQKESKIRPDFLVKSGDGITSIGGEGKKTSSRSDSPDSTRREEKILRWEMTRTKSN
jgi:hypothetical protein